MEKNQIQKIATYSKGLFWSIYDKLNNLVSNLTPTEPNVKIKIYKKANVKRGLRKNKNGSKMKDEIF